MRLPVRPEPRHSLSLASRPLTLGTLSPSENVVSALVAILPTTCHCWHHKKMCHPLLLISWLLVLLILRLGRRVHKQSRSLRNPEDAAVEGSCFAAVNGLSVHYVKNLLTTTAPRSSPSLLLHLNHGFGANALTWDPVIAPLASALAEHGRSRISAVHILAHDRLGFGLSGRPSQLYQFGEDFQAGTALGLLDAMPGACSAATPESASAPLPPPPLMVFVGHSIGAVLSARMALQRRGCGVRGLVLIAPAIFSPTPPLPRVARTVASFAVRLARAILCGLLRIFEPLLRVLLQLLIAQPRFWQRGVAMAYADPQKLAPEMLLRYRWPVQVRGSSVGFLRFVRAQLLDTRRGGAQAEVAGSVEVELPLWEELQSLQLPILIIHGTQDRLVPVTNSRRLAASMPGCTLLELPECGHNPHEESPGKVCCAVCDFVHGLGIV